MWLDCLLEKFLVEHSMVCKSDVIKYTQKSRLKSTLDINYYHQRMVRKDNNIMVGILM